MENTNNSDSLLLLYSDKIQAILSETEKYLIFLDRAEVYFNLEDVKKIRVLLLKLCRLLIDNTNQDFKEIEKSLSDTYNCVYVVVCNSLTSEIEDKVKFYGKEVLEQAIPSYEYPSKDISSIKRYLKHINSLQELEEDNFELNIISRWKKLLPLIDFRDLLNNYSDSLEQKKEEEKENIRRDKKKDTNAILRQWGVPIVAALLTCVLTFVLTIWGTSRRNSSELAYMNTKRIVLILYNDKKMTTYEISKILEMPEKEVRHLLITK